MDTNGIITTVAGNGAGNFTGNGCATCGGLAPDGIAVDVSGNLFIADGNNSCIRKVNGGGITTYAGSGGLGFYGDGGIATSALLNWPDGVAIDASGKLFIADQLNNRIRKVYIDSNYPFYTNITTVAGNGTNSFSGDGGAAINAAMAYPRGVAVDNSGNLFIADGNNNRIRKVATNGIISTLAGNGTASFSGDGGAATNAALSNPSGVAIDGSGNLLIADKNNNRIRKVSFNGLPSLNFNNVLPAIAGNYSVIISSASGSVTSSIASLIVAPIGYKQFSGQLQSGGKMRLLFMGLVGTNYALDRSFGLSPANWIPQVTNPADTNGKLIFTNTPDPITNNFWRIRSVP